jgi:tetratricopeptide (TPR) repeat protein
MRCWVLLLCVWLALPAWAAVDPQAQQPYRVEVVTRIAEHRHFTPTFRAQFGRDLLDNLRAALGTLAEVDWFDLNHIPPVEYKNLWKLATEQGLAALDGSAALPTNRLTPTKTHFVFVDYIDGQYTITTRQHDGNTGLASPVVRQVQTPERAEVGRRAVRLIGLDFGIVGTLPDKVTGDTFDLALRGGGIADAPLRNWVRKGEVFALVQLLPPDRSAEPTSTGPKSLVPTRPTPGSGPITAAGRGVRVAGTLLIAQSEPQNGQVRVKMFSRYGNPISAGAVGYRAIKLGTVIGPARVQLVDEKFTPLNAANFRVRANSTGKNEPTNQREVLQVQEGFYQSERAFNHVAFVWVAAGSNPVSGIIPLEILDDRVLTASVNPVPGAEMLGELLAKRSDTQRQINDAFNLVSDRFRELVGLLQKGKNSDAHKIAVGTLEALDIEMQLVKGQIAQLANDARGLPEGNKFNLADVQQNYKQLELVRGRLQERIKELKKAVDDENDPSVAGPRKALQAAANQAQLCRDQADFEQAIKIYENALAEHGEQADIRAALDNLKSAWAIKDAEHEQARRFIYDEWPKLTTAQAMKEKLPQLQASFAKCKAVNDRLTPAKILLTRPATEEALTQQAKALKPQESAEDRETGEIIRQVIDGLTNFYQAVSTFLEGR